MGDVFNNAAKHRFELAVDGHLAISEYTRDGNVITFTHTEVPSQLAGRGIASQLISGALNQVRSAGLKVVARCEFVNGYIAKHSEYADLLADRPG